MNESTVCATRLCEVRDEVRDELRKADAKATTMLALIGGTLAAVVALTGRDLPPMALILVWAAAAPIAAAAGLLLSVVRPRLPGAVPGTWLHAATVNAVLFLDACRTSGLDATADDVRRLAVIARAKYVRLHHAVVLLACGLCVLACGLAVIAATGPAGGAQ